MNYSKFTLAFSMHNDAFIEDPASEAARILRAIAKRLEDGVEYGSAKDINGNTVGEWSLWED